jgi:hypothetical protein
VQNVLLDYANPPKAIMMGIEVGSAGQPNRAPSERFSSSKRNVRLLSRACRNQLITVQSHELLSSSRLSAAL